MSNTFFSLPNSFKAKYKSGIALNPNAKLDQLHDYSVIFFDSLEDSEGFRTALCELTFPFTHMEVLDLGTLGRRNDSASFKNEIVEVNKNISCHLTHVFDNQISTNDLLLISPSLQVLEAQAQHSKSFAIAAHQRHLCDPAQLLERKSIALGELKNDVSPLEPLIRQCRTLVFDLHTIKASEMMSDSGSPVGLTILDACKVARYAGFSDNLRHIQMILPKQMNKTQHSIVALFLWYFWEGRNEYLHLQKNKTQLTSYILATGEIDMDLEFLKDEHTSKWWLRNPLNPSEKIPCSYADYEKALNGENPAFLLSLLEMVE